MERCANSALSRPRSHAHGIHELLLRDDKRMGTWIDNVDYSDGRATEGYQETASASSPVLTPVSPVKVERQCAVSFKILTGTLLR